MNQKSVSMLKLLVYSFITCPFIDPHCFGRIQIGSDRFKMDQTKNNFSLLNFTFWNMSKTLGPVQKKYLGRVQNNLNEPIDLWTRHQLNILFKPLKFSSLFFFCHRINSSCYFTTWKVKKSLKVAMSHNEKPFSNVNQIIRTCFGINQILCFVFHVRIACYINRVIRSYIHFPFFKCRIIIQSIILCK